MIMAIVKYNSVVVFLVVVKSSIAVIKITGVRTENPANNTVEAAATIKRRRYFFAKLISRAKILISNAFPVALLTIYSRMLLLLKINLLLELKLQLYFCFYFQ